ncbi:MAG: 4Fe-4S ferredoxin [Kamptonema sp. SIO4C4]|nr:4Fe-4S ferredoxin [Kamptonema sp. SIO4C4]
MSELSFPLQSLSAGHWFKLICGASFQHLPTVRSLTLAYTLAGVDCIDVAADPAVLEVAKEAIAVAMDFADAARKRGFGVQSRPWLMVSLNDGEDPHFRKAAFNPTQCPSDCPRPCEAVCPADAIAFTDTGGIADGVIDARCYGCGRCLPVCPSELIFTRSYVSTPETLAPELFKQGIDAVEIHSQTGHLEDFQRLWQALAPWQSQLKLLAVSCPDHADLISYLHTLKQVVSPLSCPLLWQTDGRPMSGDIGKGTTRAAVNLAAKVLQSGLPEYVQLAGGTNQHTVTKLAERGLLSPAPHRTVAGIAYGSYARKQLQPLLDTLEERTQDRSQPLLEEHPDLLWQAVYQASQLVSPLKRGTRRGTFLPTPPARSANFTVV